MRGLVITVSAIIMLLVAPSAYGVNTFRVAVKPGAYALYRVGEAYNVSVGDYFLKPGDRIGFVVKGKTVRKVAYINGTTAFQTEIVLCDVYLNDKLLLRNTTPQQFGLFSPYAPPGLEYWEAQEGVLKSLKKYYSEHGNRMYYSMVAREDYIRLYIKLVNPRGSLEEETKVNVDTGLLLEFSRHIYNSAGRLIKAFSGSVIEYATSKPTSKPTQTSTTAVSYGGGEEWLWVLIGMILIVVIGGFIGGRRRRA